MLSRRQSNPVPEEASSIKPLASNLQNSNRDTPGNRNRHNSPITNDLKFSNRDKRRGVDGRESEKLAKPPACLSSRSRLALGLKCSAAGLSAASYSFESVAAPAHRGG